jgi:hypothetical protein
MFAWAAKAHEENRNAAGDARRGHDRLDHGITHRERISQRVDVKFQRDLPIF